MDIKLSCNHVFYLSFRYVQKVKEKHCEECGMKISGNAFICLRCRVWLHASCTDKMLHDLHLAHEVMHPLHLQHQLLLEWSSRDFLCDKCLYISAGYRYNCYSCDFNLDFTCASSVNDQLPKDQELLRFEDGKRKTIQHYSHAHELSFFKYRQIDAEDYDCFWCDKHLSEVCYGCIECKFYLHQVCSDKIPRRLSHPFHPGHPLRLQYTRDTDTHCSACENIFDYFSPRYMCEMCSFLLHFHCAKLLPTLKLKFHHHLLTYFRDFAIDHQKQDLCCKDCDKQCGGASVYRCVECHFNLHLKCAIPLESEHRYHRHTLILTESFREDDIGEYYCDVCEKERNSKHPVYCCQSCSYVAHIKCVLNEDQISSGKVPSSSSQSMESKALIGNEMEHNNVIRTLMRPIMHSHQMYEVSGELNGKRICHGCRLVLNGPSYFCETCPDFYLHERCAKLPYEIQHPLHSSHPLNLYTSYNPWVGRQLIICDECREVCLGFIYFCEWCNFKLDVKCATLRNHKTGVSQEKETDRVTELQHFNHHHKLALGYCNDPEAKIKCTICELPILGPIYFCPDRHCNYILHESCLGLPQKIQVPFHQKHMLIIRVFQENSNPQCYACPLGFESFMYVYNCEDCDLNLHPICANSLRRPLKCESHGDDLYYFGTDYQKLCANYDLSREHFSCCECEESCQGEAFYRCLECRVNFHLKCVPIPDKVKSKYHIHPLTLKDSFVEDDSGEYYCDFCEKVRKPNDHVYYCQECGETIAHIECVLAQVEDNMVDFKKRGREVKLHKKRREGFQAQPKPASLKSAVEKKLENLPAMVAGVWTHDRNLQLETTTWFKNLLCTGSPPIEEVIQAGVVPRFVEFLTREDFPQLQFAAAWALTNITAGTSKNTKAVIDHGAIPILVKLFDSSNDDVREQAIWALGNVAADSRRSRDLILAHDALIPLLAQLNEHAKLSMLRIATRTLQIFCGGNLPRPPFYQVKPALPALARLIHSDDEDVLTNACWALSDLSDGTNENIQAVIEAGVCGRLVELLMHPSPSVLKPALLTVGNIVTGDDVQTQCIVSCRQALPSLFNLLANNYEKSIKKEACWTISNITAGNKEQIQAVIEANIIAPVVHLLENAEFEIKKEAAWAISNATDGTNDQIRFLVRQGCVKPLCDLLTCPDPSIVTVCLEALENILKAGEEDKAIGSTGGVNPYARMIDDAKGREKIENLRSHYDTVIRKKAVKVLDVAFNTGTD